MKTRIDVYSAELELLHDGLEWRETGCNVLGLVGEGFEEPSAVLLAVKPDDESFEREVGNSRRGCQELGAGVGDGMYFSAWSMIMPVISSIGMSDWSMSTTRMRDVTDISPPRLYRSCLRH